MNSLELNDEKLDVAENMKNYGGSFVSSLGEALIHADEENAERIKETWPEYWKQYKEM